jgi:hypothetical protein
MASRTAHSRGFVVLRPLEDRDLRTLERRAVERCHDEGQPGLSVDRRNGVEPGELGAGEPHLQTFDARGSCLRAAAAPVGDARRRANILLPAVDQD